MKDFSWRQLTLPLCIPYNARSKDIDIHLHIYTLETYTTPKRNLDRSLSDSSEPYMLVSFTARTILRSHASHCHVEPDIQEEFQKTIIGQERWQSICVAIICILPRLPSLCFESIKKSTELLFFANQNNNYTPY